jgi:hypothetical protein
MSTLLYSALTNQRDKADPGTSERTQPPGVKTYVDALAALVPAEVLALHALALSVTTETGRSLANETVTTIKDPNTLFWTFIALNIVSVVLYVVNRLRMWERLDIVRMLIPPLAFIGWTMIQKTTAFDAVAPGLPEAPRYVIASIGAALVGLLARHLAYAADQRPAPPAPAGG